MAANIEFQPRAKGGLCSSMRSRLSSFPLDRRARMVATSSAISGSSGLQYSMFGMASLSAGRVAGVNAAQGAGAFRLHRSDIEEHRFAFSLQADVEAVDHLAVACLALCDQVLSAHFPLDQVEHRVFRVGLGFVAEI